MLLLDGPLTFREFMTKEELPLATVFREVLTFLVGRDDVVLFGAQAVDAYCEPPRMTADVDILATDAPAFAEPLRAHLAAKFDIAVRVREMVTGGYRVYQLRKPKNRHLVYVRAVAALPEHRAMGGVPVVVPAELAAMKACAIGARAAQPKGDTDRADLRRLLLACPELREGDVADRLRAQGADASVLALWEELQREHVEPDEDEDD